MALSIIILAAGQGTRMRSVLPKVLHPLGGKPLLGHVIDTAHTVGAADIHVVYGHGGGQVQDAFSDSSVSWVEQSEQLGTGHAVAQALPELPDDNLALVLYGDVPLIQGDTLTRLCGLCSEGALALLTAVPDDPTGYGRIVRDEDGHIRAIVEHKDANEDERAIREINTGILAAPARRLKDWVARLDNRNAQGEYYLTDVIAMAVADGVPVASTRAGSLEEILGVNSKAQLAVLERAYQRRRAEELMTAGVTLLDPTRLDVRGDVTVGRDVVIDANVVLEGRVELGDGVCVGPFCLLRNVTVGAGTEVLSHSNLDQADIGPACRVGPYARIRPGTVLAEQVHIGNFVEVKNARINSGSKVNHLSYVGDSRVGRRVNIGAGTITCNYDGANKHLTVIGDDVFVGSDTQLVAPVTVGAGATIGAGSTITKNVPPGGLTLSRAPQRTREGWQRPQKKK